MSEKSLTFVFEEDGSTTVVPKGNCRMEDMVRVIFHSIDYLAQEENMSTVVFIEQMLATHIQYEKENENGK